MAKTVRGKRKLGIALSGGGFRASLFHIGVLSKLAELDLLRPIEAISCVSGGSIIGAYYYLHLKNLFESKRDTAIAPADYAEILGKIQVDFLTGVQTNLRVRAFSNFWKNWKMFRRDYSRSDRMAELYDDALYDRVAGRKRVPLSALKIQPAGGPEGFHPRKHNGARLAKVPMLIINATTLNTGRNWQFTAVDMGEREPDEQVRDFDRNFFLPAFRFESAEIPGKYRTMPLSIAVAASACVPGIFHPLALTGLYPTVTPELVDGGVQDNQGISSLLFEKCTGIITSDASGQLDDVDRPGSGVASVIQRTNSILMARVRALELESLEVQTSGGSLKASPILHLRKDVRVEQLLPGRERQIGDDDGRTSYGINERVQRRLSEIRTDLDSFTDVEAYSLMHSGYAMAGSVIAESLEEYGNGAPRTSWSKRQTYARQPGPAFTAIRPFAEAASADTEYLRQLSVGKKTLFKAYALVPHLIPVGIIIVVLSLLGPAAIIGGAWLLLFGPLSRGVVISCGIVALLALVGGILGVRSVRHMWWSGPIRLVITAAVAIFGSLLSYLHLKWIDPKFLAAGKVEKLTKV